MNTVDTDSRALAALPLLSEQDVFSLRRGGLAAAGALGLEQQDRVRLATALSELGRQLLGADGLTVAFGVRGGATLRVEFTWGGDRQPARETLAMVSRLVHRADYRPGGRLRRVTVEQPLPAAGSTAAAAAAAAAVLRRSAPASLSDELREQTRDLIATLEETRAQREELRRLNEELEETNKGVMALYTELSQELEETNSGVVALHTELEEASRLLRESAEAKVRLWNSVSHELRTPVNAVVSLSQLLSAPGSAPLDGEQRRQVSLIAASGRTLRALVDDLLDVAKAESGQLEIVWSRVDLRTLVGQLAAVLRGTFPGTDVALVLPDAAALPVVTTDETLLARILRNLLSNALKFTEKGEVRLDVRHEDAGAGGEWLAYTVTDTGVGIPAGELDRVFQEFYQVRGPHQRGHRGTGLGLPYARTLTELLGGTLRLAGAPGAGTRAEVRLPVHPPPPGAAPAGGGRG